MIIIVQHGSIGILLINGHRLMKEHFTCHKLLFVGTMKLSLTTSFMVITAGAQKPLTASHDDGQRSSVGKIIGGLSVPEGKVGLSLRVTATASP